MAAYPRQRLKLIFNPTAGRSDVNPAFLQEIITELQYLNFLPEVYIIQPGIDIYPVLDDAFKHKIRLFVICGGDGTIENIAAWASGKRVLLGIIPAGTQNNLALSLGIPSDIKAATSLLRTGQRSKIDIGIAKSGTAEVQFLEVCSIGLFSALFNSADDLQKGNLNSLGEIFSTLTSFPTAHFQLVLDGQKAIDLHGHVIMVANLPYFGINYRLTPNSPFDDGLLDILVFTEFSKLELVGNVLQANATNEGSPDERIRRFRSRNIKITTDPDMPVQADSTPLGNTPVTITTKRRAISFLTGLPSENQPRWGFLHNINFFRFFKK